MVLYLADISNQRHTQLSLMYRKANETTTVHDNSFHKNHSIFSTSAINSLNNHIKMDQILWFVSFHLNVLQAHNWLQRYTLLLARQRGHIYYSRPRAQLVDEGHLNWKLNCEKKQDIKCFRSSFRAVRRNVDTIRRWKISKGANALSLNLVEGELHKNFKLISVIK